MNIDDFDKRTLEIGFPITRVKDVITIIMIRNEESFIYNFIYSFFVLVFYILGCFDVRFYQFDILPFFPLMRNRKSRFVSFHLRYYNPISIFASIVFSILNFLFGKDMNYLQLKISNLLVIDIDDTNHAYVVDIKTK